MNTTEIPNSIFLLIGQSNMAGRGPIDTVEPIDHPRIRMFRDGQWVLAQEPLHTDKPDIAGVGLGMSFALSRVQHDPDAVIGLIPCAVGGTPLARWMPGADLYANAVDVAQQAGGTGPRLNGILWHQGEADSKCAFDAESYSRRLAQMIAAMRTELDAPDVPFIIGQLGAFIKDFDGPHSDFFHVVNDQLAGVCDTVPHCAGVSASGLTDNGDHIHFDAPSLREFGRRYAAAYERLVTHHKEPHP